jgi:hypothetical protein
LNPTPLEQDPNFVAMQSRLLNMENALTRVINHLDRQRWPRQKIRMPYSDHR